MNRYLLGACGSGTKLKLHLPQLIQLQNRQCLGLKRT